MGINGEPLTILLVEDNPAHAELVFRSFQEHRVANRIIHVEDGETALNYLFRRDEFTDPTKCPRPHMVLLDLRLPKVDGLEVLEQMKGAQNLRSIPVVILTTSQAESDIARAYHHHANSYLVKPVDFAKFTQLMEDLGYYWLCWNREP